MTSTMGTRFFHSVGPRIGNVHATPYGNGAVAVKAIHVREDWSKRALPVWQRQETKEMLR
jgi:hypothetical protein